MPETSMDENDRLVSRQNDVRFPGKSFDIDAIAKSAGKEGLAKRNFRLRPLVPDSGHDLGSFFTAPDIHGVCQLGNPAFLSFCRLK